MAQHKLKQLLLLRGGKCFYCRGTLTLTRASLEHVLPSSKGGTEELDNLCVCCREINQLLADLPPKTKIDMLLKSQPINSCLVDRLKISSS